MFDTLLEAKVLIERWRVRYNTVRPHSSLGYRPPAPEAIVPWTPAFGASLARPGPYGRGGRGTNIVSGITGGGRSKDRAGRPD